MKKSKRRTSLKYSETFTDSVLSSNLPYPNNQPPDKDYLTNENQFLRLYKSLVEQRDYLLTLLLSLDGIIQSPKYHPESDTLYHSLQVFELAYQESNDPVLWLAALFHDVGKDVDSRLHARIGAELVSEILPYRAVWLIEHHLDLMISPRKTQHRLANTEQLKDLVKLRGWDLGGRSKTAIVRSVDKAFELVLSALSVRGSRYS